MRHCIVYLNVYLLNHILACGAQTKVLLQLLPNTSNNPIQSKKRENSNHKSDVYIKKKDQIQEKMGSD